MVTLLVDLAVRTPLYIPAYKQFEFSAYIPFEQHNIVEHSRVLLYYHPKRDLIGCKLRVLRGVHDSNFRPDRIKIRIQRDHKVIQDQIEDWKSPPTPLKYNFNDY